MRGFIVGQIVDVFSDTGAHIGWGRITEFKLNGVYVKLAPFVDLWFNLDNISARD